MMNWFFRLLGWERCCICNRWTELSIIYGNVCSIKCLNKKRGEII